MAAVEWHGTTICAVRKGGMVAMAGDGQVSAGPTVVKGNARKVRRLGDNILVGFAGSTADALTLLERLEKKLEEYPGQVSGLNWIGFALAVTVLLEMCLYSYLLYADALLSYAADTRLCGACQGMED